LKYYREHQKKELIFDRENVPYENLTQEELHNVEHASGPYVFMPEWFDQQPHSYGKLVKDI
jgi:hypothetical protein